MDWNGRLLQTLVYERVRRHVDLLSLVDFQRELEDSIDRALAAGGAETSDAVSLSRDLLDDAWRRLEAEWRTVRAADCPLCAVASELAPTVS